MPWLYPSSLLYFISGVLEPQADCPLAGMTRYYSLEPPYTGAMFSAINEFLCCQARIVQSKTAGDASPGF